MTHSENHPTQAEKSTDHTVDNDRGDGDELGETPDVEQAPAAEIVNTQSEQQGGTPADDQRSAEPKKRS